MTLEHLIAVVLALLLKMEPSAPHRETFDRTAVAIASASMATPLFSGKDGPERTAYLVASVADFESGFIADAEGDCTKDGKAVASKAGRCPAGATPHSFCLLQINESNFKDLGTTREEVLRDVDVCVRLGMRMMKKSFEVCRARPLDERLRWYAAGPKWETSEDATKKSKHRVAKALWWFRESPPAP